MTQQFINISDLFNKLLGFEIFLILFNFFLFCNVTFYLNGVCHLFNKTKKKLNFTCFFFKFATCFFSIIFIFYKCIEIDPFQK